MEEVPVGADGCIGVGGRRISPDDLAWQQSTRPGSDPSRCVEVAFVDDEHILMRSVGKPDVMIVLTAAMWDDFVERAKAGEFD